jgi:hypothetical protein
MKELERKDAPEIGGGRFVTPPILPDGPVITPTYPVPEYPQYPTTPVEPVTGTQKL